MMQVRIFWMMTVDMFPLHLQSQIRDLIGNRHQRGPEMADEKVAPGPGDPDDPDDPDGENSEDPAQRNIPELE